MATNSPMIVAMARNVNGATNKDENGEGCASDDDHLSKQDDWNRSDIGRNAGTPDDHGNGDNRNSRGCGNRKQNGNKKSDTATVEASLQEQVAELQTAVSMLTDLFTQFTKKLKPSGTNDHKTL
jgi:hypothetical protein